MIHYIIYRELFKFKIILFWVQNQQNKTLSSKCEIRITDDANFFRSNSIECIQKQNRVSKIVLPYIHFLTTRITP